jgi:hypothetical protein
MANNYVVKDGNGASVTFVSYDTGGGIEIAQSVPSNTAGTPFSDSVPQSVAVQARQTTWTDKSSTLSGTSSQSIVASNVSRKGFWIQNQDSNNTLYINLIGGTAGAGVGIMLPPYAVYEMPIHMISTTAITAKGINGHVFSAAESS